MIEISRKYLLVIKIPFSLSDLDSMEYRPVRVKGKFLHDRELIMGPRSLITPNDDHKGGLLTQQDSSIGYLIITPFQLEDRKYVMINHLSVVNYNCNFLQQYHLSQSGMGAEK